MSKKNSAASKGRLRTAARLAAVQALYDMELSAHGADDVILACKHRGFVADLDGEDVPVDPDLFVQLVRGVSGAAQDLDLIVDGAMDGKRQIARLDSLIRSILRAGAFELSRRDDIDPPVTISAYMSVATAFFDGGEPAFVNGVLDRIARVLRADTMVPRDGHDGL